MKNLLRSCLAPLLVLLATAPPAPAQITFTVTATAGNTAVNAAQGYAAGHAYTFAYTLTEDYPLNHNYFPDRNNGWFEKDITTEPALFTTVGGTGLGGTFIDPVGPAGSPFSMVRFHGTNFIEMFAGADAGDIGLTTLAGTTLTHAISNMNLEGINFVEPATYTNPADFFSAYLGEYRAWGGSVGLYGGGFDGASFQVTSLRISDGIRSSDDIRSSDGIRIRDGISSSYGISNSTAIPEPSTYAALFGLGALGIASWRRKKRKLKLES